ncbi:acyltransferase family protein [bacterium]|nr:acyltransferase family protein [bacterium]
MGKNHHPARYYELDWLRVFAVLVLVFFHSSEIFSFGWFHLKNSESSGFFNYVSSFIHIWHMPLFFLIAGASTWFALGTSLVSFLPVCFLPGFPEYVRQSENSAFQRQAGVGCQPLLRGTFHFSAHGTPYDRRNCAAVVVPRFPDICDGLGQCISLLASICVRVSVVFR